MSEGAGRERLTTRERKRLERLSTPRARGLTLLSIVALLLSPFSIPTFGTGMGLGVILIGIAIILERRGYRARGPLAAGVVSVVVGATSAGACGWFVLRTAEVTGREEVRQDRVEDRFDKAFEKSERPPTKLGQEARDGGVAPDADSPPPHGTSSGAEDRR